jgi:hypothetical protein
MSLRRIPFVTSSCLPRPLRQSGGATIRIGSAYKPACAFTWEKQVGSDYYSRDITFIFYTISIDSMNIIFFSLLYIYIIINFFIIIIDYCYYWYGIYYYRVRRLDGLEGLSRLEVLDLHGNQLSTLGSGLSTLSELKVLNVAGNQLRNIIHDELQGLAALEELNLRRNRLRRVDGVANAPNLNKLFLSNNNIQR